MVAPAKLSNVLLLVSIVVAVATASARQTSPLDGDACDANDGRGVNFYRFANIISPANDMAVRSNAGKVLVLGHIERELRCGDRVQLLLDGAPMGAPLAKPEFSLVNIDRGTHQLQLRIVDAANTALFTGEPSTFHLLRHSRLHP